MEGILFEEAFHMYHQNGLAKVYPEIFGMDSFDQSVVCRETARLQCVSPGWMHPENKCPDGAPFEPGNPASSPLEPGYGDCTYPSCDCAEFYRQALTLYMDWDTNGVWYSPYMPSNRNDFMNMASAELLDVLSNPIYNQPQGPLPRTYDVKGVLGSLGNGVGATCHDKFKFMFRGRKRSCKWVAKNSSKRCTYKVVRNECKKTCDNCSCENESGGELNGEEACEGHGYTEEQCLQVGNDCCHWNVICWSSIGQDTCQGLD